MSRLQVVDSEDAWAKPPTLDQELGTSFSWHDRIFMGWRDGLVFDYGDWAARDIQEMLTKGYKSRQLEQVLTGPLMSATHTIDAGKGDKGESEWLNDYLLLDGLNGGMHTPFELVLAQMTSAIYFKKAFFEKVWGLAPDGKIGYTKLAWRPATTCRAMRHPVTGQMAGFEQESYGVGPTITKGHWPVQIKQKNAFVYIHGQHRDPINGISDLEITYWCWKTQQKLLFLWFNYLEALSHPRVAVISNDGGLSTQVAGQLSKLKGGGIVPVTAPGGPSSLQIQPIDASGNKGATEFFQAIQYLDQCAANSISAGFTNLTDMGKNGGSYALSKDASDFFVQSLEYKNTERAREIRKGIFAPLIRYNFGPEAVVPTISFEPLNAEDKSDAVTMLTDLMRSRDPALVPDEFIGMLATMVADYMGMDGQKVRAAFDKAAADAKKAAAAQSAAGGTPAGQNAAAMNGAANAAGSVLKSAPPRRIPGSIPGTGGQPPLPSTY